MGSFNSLYGVCMYGMILYGAVPFVSSSPVTEGEGGSEATIGIFIHGAVSINALMNDDD